ncbi:uncharacterized protein EI97DRAFT_499442 [Westerdykella ornata]|uniref:Uncharacterized protein n=1 Tax=Westerdykella ornata TaxID=318751 RepID=A0A6A6JQK7_WESOR|nr:uncharacterized protein EI97DRAFT_499442 [Westerdykella ornata]KAF2278911.1 hypothetical protein EI97DRAFT_499442 [Westerdykella ornata]
MSDTHGQFDSVYGSNRPDSQQYNLPHRTNAPKPQLPMIDHAANGPWQHPGSAYSPRLPVAAAPTEEYAYVYPDPIEAMSPPQHPYFCLSRYAPSGHNQHNCMTTPERQATPICCSLYGTGQVDREISALNQHGENLPQDAVVMPLLGMCEPLVLVPVKEEKNAAHDQPPLKSYQCTRVPMYVIIGTWIEQSKYLLSLFKCSCPPGAPLLFLNCRFLRPLYTIVAITLNIPDTSSTASPLVSTPIHLSPPITTHPLAAPIV